MRCPGAAASHSSAITCGLEHGHLPPHYDPLLGVWWSIPPHLVPEHKPILSQPPVDRRRKANPH